MSAALNFQFLSGSSMRSRNRFRCSSLRKMQKHFDGSRSVAVKVFFQIHDGAIPLLPDVLFVAQFLRQALAAKNLRMHPNHQHFLVIRAVKYPDPPAFRKHARGSPEKIVFQFVGARLFETENLAALRIDSGHDVPDGAVLSRPRPSPEK